MRKTKLQPRSSQVRAAINRAAIQRPAGPHGQTARAQRRTAKQSLSKGQWDQPSAHAFR